MEQLEASKKEIMFIRYQKYLRCIKDCRILALFEFRMLFTITHILCANSKDAQSLA
jgi:hypothetical protein